MRAISTAPTTPSSQMLTPPIRKLRRLGIKCQLTQGDGESRERLGFLGGARKNRPGCGHLGPKRLKVGRTLGLRGTPYGEVAPTCDAPIVGWRPSNCFIWRHDVFQSTRQPVGAARARAFRGPPRQHSPLTTTGGGPRGQQQPWGQAPRWRLRLQHWPPVPGPFSYASASVEAGIREGGVAGVRRSQSWRARVSVRCLPLTRDSSGYPKAVGRAGVVPACRSRVGLARGLAFGAYPVKLEETWSPPTSRKD